MEPGQVLAIKTTGELVTVIGKDGDKASLLLVVRRPKMGPSGVEHLVDEFNDYELESPEEHINREAKEQLARQIAQREIINKGMRQYEEGQVDEPEIILN